MAHPTALPASGPQLDNRRVLAALIDLAIVAAGAALIQAAAGVLGKPLGDVGAPVVAVCLGWTLYYYFACESGSGQTLGKRVMRIRVVRTDGAPAGMREIGLRTLLRIVDMQLVYLVGLIVMLATRERRGRLGDLVGGTMIVSADETAPEPPPAEARREEAASPQVPIAESGPAFAAVAEEPPAEQPLAEQPPAEQPAPDETVELETPALQELASDVTATAGSAPDEEERAGGEEVVVAEEPLAENAPLADEAPPVETRLAGPPVEAPLAETPLADPPVEAPPVEDDPVEDDPVEDEPIDEPPADEPAAEHEPADAVEIRSVETVSAIDLIMEDSRRES